MIDLLYSTSEYELSDLSLLSYVHLLVVVLSRIAKGRDALIPLDRPQTE